jgi:hypothetical protein
VTSGRQRTWKHLAPVRIADWGDSHDNVAYQEALKERRERVRIGSAKSCRGRRARLLGSKEGGKERREDGREHGCRKDPVAIDSRDDPGHDDSGGDDPSRHQRNDCGPKRKR